jgi:hypothetical protein
LHEFRRDLLNLLLKLGGRSPSSQLLQLLVKLLKLLLKLLPLLLDLGRRWRLLAGRRRCLLRCGRWRGGLSEYTCRCP